jgi:protein disulfide-isomerase-like protein
MSRSPPSVAPSIELATSLSLASLALAVAPRRRGMVTSIMRPEEMSHGRPNTCFRPAIVLAWSLCALLASVATASSDTEQPRDDDGHIDGLASHVLTLSNFDRHVGNGSHWLVMFYAPWCGHCRRLGPTIDAAAAACADDPTASVGRVDATAELALAARFLVDSYPVVLAIEADGSSRNYRGPRNEDAIVAFLHNASLPDDKRGAMALLVEHTGWLSPLSPMAPWLRWPYRFHPLTFVFYALPFEVGLPGNLLFLVFLLPIYIALVVVLLICLLEGVGKLGDCCRGGDSPERFSIGASESGGSASAVVMLKVDGLSCQGCVTNVTKALEAVVGVERATVNLEGGSATVVGTASAVALIAVVDQLGKSASVIEEDSTAKKRA